MFLVTVLTVCIDSFLLWRVCLKGVCEVTVFSRTRRASRRRQRRRRRAAWKRNYQVIGPARDIILLVKLGVDLPSAMLASRPCCDF